LCRPRVTTEESGGLETEVSLASSLASGVLNGLAGAAGGLAGTASSEHPLPAGWGPLHSSSVPNNVALSAASLASLAPNGTAATADEQFYYLYTCGQGERGLAPCCLPQWPSWLARPPLPTTGLPPLPTTVQSAQSAWRGHGCLPGTPNPPPLPACGWRPAGGLLFTWGGDFASATLEPCSFDPRASVGSATSSVATAQGSQVVSAFKAAGDDVGSSMGSNSCTAAGAAAGRVAGAQPRASGTASSPRPPAANVKLLSFQVRRLAPCLHARAG
jgi:hypothetical protein